MGVSIISPRFASLHTMVKSKMGSGTIGLSTGGYVKNLEDVKNTSSALFASIVSRNSNLHDKLKVWAEQARERYLVDDRRWVKFDGARHDTVHQIQQTLPSPSARVLRWPVPYSQETGRRCAFHSVSNIGYELPDDMLDADLQSIIDHLVKTNTAKVLIVFLLFLRVFRL